RDGIQPDRRLGDQALGEGDDDGRGGRLGGRRRAGRRPGCQHPDVGGPRKRKEEAGPIATGTALHLRLELGRGTAHGRISGRVVWSNYPRRRSDGRMLPNARGLVTTDDGASIFFELRGRTVFGDDGIGRQNLVGWFEAGDERYRWLNDIVCIAEGLIGEDEMQIRVYAGVLELEP